MTEVEKKNMSTGKKVAIAIGVVVILVAGYFALNIYQLYFSPNITENQKYLYIKTGQSYDELIFRGLSVKVQKKIQPKKKLKQQNYSANTFLISRLNILIKKI